MTPLDMITDLYRHMAWADASAWTHVLAHENSANDRRVRELLHHIHLVQRAYLGIWTGKQPDFREASSFESSAAVANWGRETHDEIAAFLAGIAPDSLADVVKLPWAERLSKDFGTPHDMNFAETLMQIPMHSMNHRGQLLTKLRELGSPAPILDFIAWVWRGKPAAKWPGDQC